VGRKNLYAKRKRRVQKRRRKIGVRWGPDEGGREKWGEDDTHIV